MTPSAAACSSLVPDSWKEGVPPPPLPEANVAADLSVFADALIGVIGVANARTRDAIDIIERCERRDAEAVRQATRRRILGIF